MKEFGEALHTLLHFKKEVWEILPVPGYSWTSGGCWILAQALHQWMGPKSSLWALKSRAHDEVEHVVVRVGTCYLDADGAAGKSEFLKIWKDEGVEKPYLEPFNPEEASRIDCPYDAVESLVSEFEAEFGPGPALVEEITH